LIFTLIIGKNTFLSTGTLALVNLRTLMNNALKVILPFLLFSLLSNSTFAIASHERKELKESTYSAAPVVSVARDGYELILGKDMLSGEDLSTGSRVLAGIGILTLGSSNIIKAGAKRIAKLGQNKLLQKVLKSGYDKVVDGVGSVLTSARKLINKIGPQRFSKVLKTPKGARPDPKTYLPTDYIQSHLKQFDDGATIFMKKSQYEKYGPAQADGTAFVLPKHEADKLLVNAGGDKRAIEEALGFPKGTLDNEKLVRIDVSNPRQHNARLPSGNEPGVNDFWIPGGKLPNGNSEAVLDLGNVSTDKLKITNID
jgi:hypothetical protein